MPNPPAFASQYACHKPVRSIDQTHAIAIGSAVRMTHAKSVGSDQPPAAAAVTATDNHPCQTREVDL
jgi:hypothetical protein